MHISGERIYQSCIKIGKISNFIFLPFFSSFSLTHTEPTSCLAVATSLSMSYPDYHPASIPSLLSQPASPFGIGIHFLSPSVPILQSRLLDCLMTYSGSKILTSSLSDIPTPTPFTAPPNLPSPEMLLAEFPANHYLHSCLSLVSFGSVTCLLSSLIKHSVCAAWMRVHHPNAKITSRVLFPIYLPVH